MQCKDRLETYLCDEKMPFEVQHRSVAYTAQHVAASEHVPRKLLAKTVMVIPDGKMVMLALPASHWVELERAAAVLGAREVRPAREAEFGAAFPDCEVGAMFPFGNLYDVPVYVDRALTEDETIVFRAGTHTDTMPLKCADCARLVRPTVAEFAHPAHA
jgi:Ala-tRNA(Pro) deacylase